MADSEFMDSADLTARLGRHAHVGERCRISRDVVINVGEDAVVAFGKGTTIRRGVTIEVGTGATAVFGCNVNIGENVVVDVRCGLRVGDGVVLSNMVDVHDHNHHDRSWVDPTTEERATWTSSFDVAPIVVEDGVVLSGKVSVLAGVRVGANSIVGANSVVSQSVPPNVVAIGEPATPVREFSGKIPLQQAPRVLLVGFFGTSIMEHYEGYAEQMFQQWNLPAVGEHIEVEGWRRRGYVDRLMRSLRIRVPHVQWQFENASRGGATSRKTLEIVTETVTASRSRYDLVYVGCGINDVWRGFQGHLNEAVEINEYRRNIERVLACLRAVARHVVFVGETPFALPEPNVDEMNEELCRYAAVAQDVCSCHSISYVDCFGPFQRLSQLRTAYGADSGPSLWSDGIHLSDDGDELMFQLVLDHTLRSGVLSDLVDYERLDQRDAAARYRDLVRAWRPSTPTSTIQPRPR